MGSHRGRSGRQDDADRWFDQAADVWTQAVRLNPGGYLDIENWLKSTGRSNVDVYFCRLSLLSPHLIAER